MSWYNDLTQSNSKRSRVYRKAAHYSGSTPGYPTSGGCFHLGAGNTEVYKKMAEIVKQNKKTMRVIYY